MKGLFLACLAAFVMVACGEETPVTPDNNGNDADSVAVEPEDNGPDIAGMMAELESIKVRFDDALTDEEKVEVTRLKAVFDSIDHTAMMANKDSVMAIYADDYASALAIADAHPDEVNAALELMNEMHGNHKACGPDCKCAKCTAKTEGEGDANTADNAVMDNDVSPSTCGPGCACDKCKAKAAHAAHAEMMANMTEEEKTNMMKVHFVIGAFGHGHAGHDHGAHCKHHGEGHDHDHSGQDHDHSDHEHDHSGHDHDHSGHEH